MYFIRGKVRKGKQRGKELGFPTANIRLHKKIPEGIYVSLLSINSKHEVRNPKQIQNSNLPSLTFIGAAKTFGQTDVMAETYILDFNQNIYGKWITIKLINMLRENKKFSGAEELIQQMKQDEREARAFFQSV